MGVSAFNSFADVGRTLRKWKANVGARPKIGIVLSCYGLHRSFHLQVCRQSNIIAQNVMSTCKLLYILRQSQISHRVPLNSQMLPTLERLRTSCQSPIPNRRWLWTSGYAGHCCWWNNCRLHFAQRMMVYSFRRPKPLHTISLSLYTDYCTLFPVATKSTILQVICVARPPRYRQTCKTLRNVPPICLWLQKRLVNVVNL